MLSRNLSPDSGVGNLTENLDSPRRRSIQAPRYDPGLTASSVHYNSESISSSNSASDNAYRAKSAPLPLHGEEDDIQSTVLKSFSPRVAVYASPDTDELIRLKGLYGGLCCLLRPFGENVPGKINIRDSLGSSRSWDNFGIHFTELRKADKLMSSMNHRASKGVSPRALDHKDDRGQYIKNQGLTKPKNASPVDEIIRYHMGRTRCTSHKTKMASSTSAASCHPPQYFSHFLRKILSGKPMTPHEMFTHPVACVVAISSQNTAPIETLRDLYNETRPESRLLPPWVAEEFLRYYVLVHDEDHDDIAKSTALFNQMKRHFGLHCHLLRLRSTQTTPGNSDCSKVPDCRWLSAEQDVSQISQKESILEFGEFQQYLFDSDAAAINTFIREMVTQSIVPYMEGRITYWNDQVASRRRGISGRFMSLSKRWTGFGAGKASKSHSSGVHGGSNYDADTGAYSIDAPESAMHRLADYAFMMRDWKLSSSIYDILRTDFADDNAWEHHAIVSEMLAMSLLLLAQWSDFRARVRNIDHILDTATYSHLTRCANPKGVIRCLVVAVELYRLKGGLATDEAAKWAERLLKLSLLTPLTQTIVVERLVACYRSRIITAPKRNALRDRKAALWLFLGSQLWLSLDEPDLARIRSEDAIRIYKALGYEFEAPRFGDMAEELGSLTTGGLVAPFTSRPLDVRAVPYDQNEDELAELYHPRLEQRYSLDKQPQAETVDLLQRLRVTSGMQDDGFSLDSG